MTRSPGAPASQIPSARTGPARPPPARAALAPVDPHRAARRRGVTLAELVVVLAVAGLLAGIAVRGVARLAADTAVRGAAAEVRTAFALARSQAVLRGARAAVQVDTAGGGVAVHARADTVWRRPLAALYGVRLSATRDSMAYAANGLGFGAANLQVVVRRGVAAETVVVSRLGRVR